MKRRLVLFLYIFLIMNSLSARQCIVASLGFFPKPGNEIGNSQLLLIELHRYYNLFYKAIINNEIYAVAESGERGDVTIVDSLFGDYGLSQILIRVNFSNLESGQMVRLQIENLPIISYKDLTERFEKELSKSWWKLTGNFEDNDAPYIPSGIRYEYDESRANVGDYRLSGRLSFVENGINYTYETDRELVPNMLLRVIDESGYYVYLPVIGGAFNWHQGYCSSYFPEIQFNRNYEFRVRLMDMSGNQLESQNKLIIF